MDDYYERKRERAGKRANAQNELLMAEQDETHLTNKDTVSKIYPNFNELLPEIENIIKEDVASGKVVLSEAEVQSFINNPFNMPDPSAMLSLAKMATDRLHQKEIKQLKTGETNAEENVIKKIKETSEKKQTIKSSANSNEPTDKQVTEDQLANMTDDELKTHLEKESKKDAA